MQSDQAVVRIEPATEQRAEARWPAPQTALGAELIALAQEAERAGLPKLTVEEVEEYLGRKLGGLAEADDAGHPRGGNDGAKADVH